MIFKTFKKIEISLETKCQKLSQMAQEIGVEIISTHVECLSIEEIDTTSVLSKENITNIIVNFNDSDGKKSPMIMVCEKKTIFSPNKKTKKWIYKLILPSKKPYGTFLCPKRALLEFNKILFI